jgi:hypothetical protein
MNKKQLVVEANNLCLSLKNKMWCSAITKDNRLYRLEQVYKKACSRYERRYQAFVEG